MAHGRGIIFITVTTLLLLALTSCSFNPFRSNNELTGSAVGAGAGAVVGGGVAALARGSATEIGIAAAVGALAGYYVTTLEFASGGVKHIDGQVYTLGDYVTIEIPTDHLFDVNTADFLPEAKPVLDSVVTILNRYPNNNIMVSGNTTGFYSAKFERKLSEDRARQVAAYLWANGISNFGDENSNVAAMDRKSAYSRKLTYVGYGSYFPISNTITAEGLRENNRIQITAYPRGRKIHMNKAGKMFDNIGSMKDAPPDNTTDYNSTFSSATHLPEDEVAAGDAFKDDNKIYPSKSRPVNGYSPVNNLKGDDWGDYKSPSTSDQTSSGGSVAKQGGFVGYKN